MAAYPFMDPPVRGHKELIPQLVGVAVVALLLVAPSGGVPASLAIPTAMLAGAALLALAMRLMQRARQRQAAVLPPRAADTARLQTISPESGLPLPDSPQTQAGAAAEGPQRPSAWGPDVLPMIEWRRFEALMEMLFAQAGFLIRAQSHGAEGGVDLWLHLARTPQTAVGVAHCHPWQSRPLGIESIRSLIGSMRAVQVGRGQCVSVSGFTAEARAFANSQGVRTVDGQGILEMILARSPAQQLDLLDTALEGDFWRPSCVTCGDKMMMRTSQAGTSFWGCVNHPRCRATQAVRTPLVRVRAA